MSFSNYKNTNVRPLKKFGQNFLKDKNIIDKIIAEINPRPDDVLLEIGPGLGVLTEELVKVRPNLTAVEIDRRLADDLRLKFPSLQLIQQDILKFDYEAFSLANNGKIRIVGNIPYNISSQILFRALDQRSFVKDIVFMVQLEVAQRIAAAHNNKTYGILSVILQCVAETRLCFKVPPTVFYPRPEVESAIIHITMKEQPEDFDFPVFKKVVKAAFGKRRKTLKNSLQSCLHLDGKFVNSPIDLSRRAEQLTIEEFKILTQYLAPLIAGPASEDDDEIPS
jgi:16S rRNA (adenine1518-N6/adenine1519-N6)-dimethyltransferase